MRGEVGRWRGGLGDETNVAVGETGTEKRRWEESKEKTEDMFSEVVFTCHHNVGQSPVEGP